MSHFKPIAAATAIAIIALMCHASAHAQQPAPLKVVELFTSQGCSSCPPADRLLGKLRKQPGILALSYHINYWDYIGWKDPFALAESTQRQRAYNKALARRNVFTPQMIIQGRHSAVGSRPSEVQTALNKAAGTSTPFQASITGDKLRVAASSVPLDIWLIEYQTQGQADVTRGENRGRKLQHYNVVRGIHLMAQHNGAEKHFRLPNSSYKQAIIIQNTGHGAIRSALKRP